MKRSAEEISEENPNKKYLKLNNDEFQVKEEPLDYFDVKEEPIDDDFPFHSDTNNYDFQVKETTLDRFEVKKEPIGVQFPFHSDTNNYDIQVKETTPDRFEVKKEPIGVQFPFHSDTNNDDIQVKEKTPDRFEVKKEPIGVQFPFHSDTNNYDIQVKETTPDRFEVKKEPIGVQFPFHSDTNNDNIQVKEKTPDRFEVKKEPIGVQFPFHSDTNNDDFQVKEEPFDLSDVKKEPIDEEEPCSSNKIQSQVDNLTWRPCLDSVLNDNFEEEVDVEIELGKSILFQEDLLQKKKDDEEPAECNEQVPKKKCLPPYKLRRALGRIYLANKHPSIEELINVAEEQCISYKGLFEDFDTRRGYDNEKCEPNDPCCRIKSYFAREAEPAPRSLDWKTQKRLDEEIESHIQSGKRFTLGYVHVIVDRTGLPPEFVRCRYSTWRTRLQNRKLTSITQYNMISDGKIDDLSIDTVKLLESAYLARKYSEKSNNDEEWSHEEIRDLSKKLGLSELKIATWLKKRARAASGVPETPETLKVLNLQPNRAFLQPKQREIMDQEFIRIGHLPNGQEMLDLQKKLKLSRTTIKNYYIKVQRMAKRKTNWEQARLEVMKLPREKVLMMEEAAKTRRITTAFKQEYSEKIGVSIVTLTSFIEWRKSQNKSLSKTWY